MAFASLTIGVVLGLASALTGYFAFDFSLFFSVITYIFVGIATAGVALFAFLSCETKTSKERRESGAAEI